MSDPDYPLEWVWKSLGDYLAIISHHWPSIGPWNVETLEFRWWVYYVRAAQELIREYEDASRGVSRHGR